MRSLAQTRSDSLSPRLAPGQSHLNAVAPSPGAFGADLSPLGRGDRARCSCRKTLGQREMFSDRAPDAVDLSPAGRGRERSERVRGAAANANAITLSAS